MRTTLHTTLAQRIVCLFLVVISITMPRQARTDADDLALKEAFAPMIPSGQVFEITENSPVGTAVGTVSATDAQGITGFEITDADALSNGTPPNDAVINALAMFDIDNNGLITVNENKYLLAVAGPVNLTVEVTNAQGQQSSALVKVNINDAVVQTSATTNISWSTGTAQPLGNSEGQSVVVGNKLYSFSGFDIQKRPAYTPTERAYVFDPALNTWTLLNPMPKMHPNAAHGGVTHAGFTTDGTNIYFAGGYAANANGNGQIFGTPYAYKYIVATDTYERLPNLPLPRAGGALEYINGKLYWVGGINAARNQDQGDLLVLDLNNLGAGWTNLTSSPLPNPRNHLGSAVLNGKLYIVGGQHEQDGDLTAQDDVHSFDPATGVWTKVTDLPDINEVPANLTPGKGHIAGSTFAYEDQIFVLGGEYEHMGPYSKAVLAYNPSTNVWTRYSDMPTVRSSGIAGIVNGTLYYSTGRNSSTTYQAVIESPSPAAGIWLEGECGAVGNNWRTISDAAASGGSYVVVPNLNSYSVPSDVPANQVRFSFSVNQAGAYHLFARLRAPNSNDDSFWIRVNGGNWVQWWENISLGNSFNWNTVTGSPFSLNQGANTIDIAYRENGAQLDKLHLNQSGEAPTGMGGNAGNCGAEVPNGAPVASAAADPLSGTAPLTVNFDGSASTDDKGIVSYSWDFGDGETGSGATPTHVFMEAGEYTVTLTVADAEGEQDQASLTVNVEEAVAFTPILLNAGGNTLTMNGEEYVADYSTNPVYYNSLHTYSNTSLNAPELYQTERGSEQNGGTLTYQIPVPNGSYAVRTHHAELYYGFNGRVARAGRRIFDIFLEEEMVRNDLDLYAEGVGVNKNYLVLTFDDIEVTDGFLTIHMDASVNRPTLSGIEVWPAGTQLSQQVLFANAEASDDPMSRYGEDVYALKVFPNALDDNALLNLQSSQEFDEELTFTLTDQSGRTVLQHPNASWKSASVITLDLSDARLVQGVYYLHVQGSKGSRQQVIRFLKK